MNFEVLILYKDHNGEPAAIVEPVSSWESARNLAVSIGETGLFPKGRCLPPDLGMVKEYIPPHRITRISIKRTS